MEDDEKNELIEFSNYNKAIFEYEDIIEKFNKFDDKNSESFKKRNGYLIESKEYEKLKNNLNCKDIKEKDRKKGKYKKYFKKNNFKKIKKIKPFEIKSVQYFINMLLNNNEYIIITDDLFDIICEIKYKYQSNVTYSINKSQIILYFEDDKKLETSNLYKNKINGYALKKKEIDKQNYEKFEILLESMNIYNKFKKKFSQELKKQKTSSFGNNAQRNYLIDKIWFDEWIYFSNYQNIKDIYFQTNLDLNKEQKIKQEIINKLIEHQEKYKNIFKLNNLKVLEFKNKEDIESYLKYNSFVIVDYNFKMKFNNEKNNFKNMNILNNKITIDGISFDSKNNIITII